LITWLAVSLRLFDDNPPNVLRITYGTYAAAYFGEHISEKVKAILTGVEQVSKLG
jgi:hypothetical protein